MRAYCWSTVGLNCVYEWINNYLDKFLINVLDSRPIYHLFTGRQGDEMWRQSLSHSRDVRVGPKLVRLVPSGTDLEQISFTKCAETGLKKNKIVPIWRQSAIWPPLGPTLKFLVSPPATFVFFSHSTNTNTFYSLFFLFLYLWFSYVYQYIPHTADAHRVLFMSPTICTVLSCVTLCLESCMDLVFLLLHSQRLSCS